MRRRFLKWRLTRLVWNGKMSINDARARLGLEPLDFWHDRIHP